MRYLLQNSWMKSRPTSLVMVCVGSLISWQMLSIWIWQPTSVGWKRQTSLKKQIAETQHALELARVDEAFLKREQATSLTGDATVGVHRYQEWLLKRTADIPGVNVATSPLATAGDMGSLARFDIVGTASLEWVSNFIDALAKTPLQHRIAYLKLDEAQGDSIQFILTLEALFMEGAPNQLSWPEATNDDQEMTLAATMQQRRPFIRGYTGPKPEPQLVALSPTVQPVVPAIDPLATFKLIGLVSIDGQPQAWMVDSRTLRELRVPTASAFEFAERSMQLLKIERDAIEIACGNSTIRWPLGTTLRSVMPN